MKRSYDYFKTLKKMNELVCGAFSCVTDSQGCESFRMSFSAEKSELINNLKNEFITPIERGDIFLLSECLSDEFRNTEGLSEYATFFFDECGAFSNLLKSCLINQGEIINKLGNQKNLVNLINPCHDGTLACDALMLKLQKKIKSIILCNESQNLLKYEICVSYLDLAKSVFNTFSEIKRIIIDNS